MLVMTRKAHEAIVVGNGELFRGTLKVTVVEVNGSEVKLAFEVTGQGGDRNPFIDLPGTYHVAQAKNGCLIVDCVSNVAGSSQR